MVKPLTQIHTISLLKPCRNLTSQKCCQNPIMHDHKQVLKHRNQSQNSDFYLFGALKDAICWKRFGSEYNTNEKVAVSTKFKLAHEGGRCYSSCWHKSVEVDADYEVK